MEAKEEFSKAIKEALFRLDLPEIEPQIEHPNEFSHGDYATNVALIVAKRFGKTPIEVADYMATELKGGKVLRDLCEKIEAVPPGFINFWLSKNELIRQLELALKDGERYPSTAPSAVRYLAALGTTLRTTLGTSGKKGKVNKTIVVEYSSPNIAKKFGIGHLRSTIIGQTIYNLYQSLGYQVIGDNHLGDWGTQFGAIIYQVIETKKDAGSLSVDELEQLYVDFNSRAKDDPKLWEEARKWFKKLEDGDNKAREIWQSCIKVSLEEFDRIYKLLGVSFDNMHGESFYEDKMTVVIQELLDKNLAVKDEGALIIKYPNDELVPGIVQKSDGATTYLARDLAQVKFRLSEWKPDLLIYEVGIEQTLHFRQLFRAVELLGWAKQDKFIHVRHGLYLSPNGQKFSTRRGETVKIEDVLNEAIEKAGKIIKSKLSDEGQSVDNQELAKNVGVGAIKYFDLSHNPESNIIFSWDKMFLLTGNSGPYLQYTHARCQSVLVKARGAGVVARRRGILHTTNHELQAEEISLLRTFYKFPEVIKDAAHQYAPNLLCNFLYDIASKYNIMYNNLPIIKQKPETEKQKQTQNFRLALTAVTARILKTGLNLLGIQAPERM